MPTPIRRDYDCLKCIYHVDNWTDEQWEEYEDGAAPEKAIPCWKEKNTWYHERCPERYDVEDRKEFERLDAIERASLDEYIRTRGE